MEKRRIVYRIENRDGIGPYRTGAAYNCYGIGYSPGPTTEGYDVPNPNYIFGFPSITKLKNWFTEKTFETLEQEGYRISVYKVPISEFTITSWFGAKSAKSVYVTPTQAFFDATRGAVRVKTISFSEFKNRSSKNVQ